MEKAKRSFNFCFEGHLHSGGLLTVPSKIIVGIIPGVLGLVSFFLTVLCKEGPAAILPFAHHAPDTVAFSLLLNTQSSFPYFLPSAWDAHFYFPHGLLFCYM